MVRGPGLSHPHNDPRQRTTKRGRKRGRRKNNQRKEKDSVALRLQQEALDNFFFSPPFQIPFELLLLLLLLLIFFFLFFFFLHVFPLSPSPRRPGRTTLSILMIIFRNSEYIFFLSFLLWWSWPPRGSELTGELGERQGQQPGTAASPPRTAVAIVHCTGACGGRNTRVVSCREWRGGENNAALGPGAIAITGVTTESCAVQPSPSLGLGHEPHHGPVLVPISHPQPILDATVQSNLLQLLQMFFELGCNSFHTAAPEVPPRNWTW